ncbi:hypothetical protein FB451DRAFT_1374074 [Mycena latifolia]|nr:hypothetical protein FB451DRAFT_1374074 [Mycena latifolia]
MRQLIAAECSSVTGLRSCCGSIAAACGNFKFCCGSLRQLQRHSGTFPLPSESEPLNVIPVPNRRRNSPSTSRWGYEVKAQFACFLDAERSDSPLPPPHRKDPSKFERRFRSPSWQMASKWNNRRGTLPPNSLASGGTDDSVSPSADKTSNNYGTSECRLKGRSYPSDPLTQVDMHFSTLFSLTTVFLAAFVAGAPGPAGPNASRDTATSPVPDALAVHCSGEGCDVKHPKCAEGCYCKPNHYYDDSPSCYKISKKMLMYPVRQSRLTTEGWKKAVKLPSLLPAYSGLLPKPSMPRGCFNYPGPEPLSVEFQRLSSPDFESMVQARWRAARICVQCHTIPALHCTFRLVDSGLSRSYGVKQQVYIVGQCGTTKYNGSLMDGGVAHEGRTKARLTARGPGWHQSGYPGRERRSRHPHDKSRDDPKMAGRAVCLNREDRGASSGDKPTLELPVAHKFSRRAGGAQDSEKNADSTTKRISVGRGECGFPGDPGAESPPRQLCICCHVPGANLHANASPKCLEFPGDLQSVPVHSPALVHCV